MPTKRPAPMPARRPMPRPTRATTGAAAWADIAAHATILAAAHANCTGLWRKPASAASAWRASAEFSGRFTGNITIPAAIAITAGISWWHRLPAVFMALSFIINDYYDLGFGAPPPGCRWVRYGPDLVLVNVRTRRIVDVVYGVFY